MRKAFIQANDKQLLGAKLAKYAIERNLKDKGSIAVEIINVDREPLFKAFAGKTYLRRGRVITYDPKDLQSFTLSRFLPPDRMGYEGMAIVIDPDIFTRVDLHALFDLGTDGKAIAACRKKDAWDSSVMLLDCARLKHWNVAAWLEKLARHELDYDEIMTLKLDRDDVKEIPRVWNSLDVLNEDTKLLHTTDRLTQPWKTGLPIDFMRNSLPKILGLIPREPIHRLLGKYPMTYQKHPDSKIDDFFFALVRDAFREGAITRSEIEEEIRLGHLRPDFIKKIPV